MGVKVHTIPVNPVTRQVDIRRVRMAMCVSSVFSSFACIHTYMEQKS